MKKILLIMLGLLTLTATAQTLTDEKTLEYRPFLKDGKVWNCQVREYVPKIVDGQYAGGEYQTSSYSLKLMGDSLLDGRTYHKMYREESDGKVTPDEYPLWREEGRKVYAYLPLIGKEALLYDFSLTPGQSTTIYEVPTALETIDTVKVGGQLFRRFYVSQGGEFIEGRMWIEGVGHPGGPSRVWGNELNDGRFYTLLSCYEDGRCIFTASDFTAPSTTGVTGPTQRLTGQVRLYDLQGRYLQGKPQHGLYVRGGRKVLVR